ncbi:hypothetical protein [Mesorhizobium sp. M0522]|uniref:rolling circle replication-associated protein n=1 Tax=Mesorhizobium sp. M0522 TaxID=2956958 RepID=UPI00333A6065
MTLTYGGGLTARSEVLTYSDVQKYLKRLRKSGHKFRYFAVGEYGSKKGRAHWHLILFYQSEPPEMEMDARIDEKHWPHGFSQWEIASNASMRYCVKYLYKDAGADESKQAKFVLSKNPAIGVPYFRKLAMDYALQGVSPRDSFYWFPDVLNSKTGKPEQFYLSKISAAGAVFLSSFVEAWLKVHGNDRWPHSDLVDWWLDRNTVLPEPLQLKPIRRGPNKPASPPPGGSKPLFSESHNCYYSETISGRLWYYLNPQGDLVWHTKIGKNGSAVINGQIPRPGGTLPDAPYPARSHDALRSERGETK